MHSEYELYAHHFGLPEIFFPEGPTTNDGKPVRPNVCFEYKPQHVFALQVTEDIDYELIEPSRLPPSNTNDNG